MPSTIKIRVQEARGLPIMDRKTGLTDAYVEVRFGDWSDRTNIARLTLDPVWNQEFRIEVTDDNNLQDLPIEFRIWDKDVMSDDSIGTVTLDLNCLLRMNNAPTKLSGWLPIYDTLLGIRGYLNCVVSVQFFGDMNPFRNSAAGVKLFSTSNPEYLGYKIEALQGFVEELMVISDPEYQWKDSFRTSRVSNEERQALFYNMARKVRRSVGRKALELGGNSILGYSNTFDLEYESGLIVARGYGTACTLTSFSREQRNSPDALESDKRKLNQKNDFESSGSDEIGNSDSDEGKQSYHLSRKHPQKSSNISKSKPSQSTNNPLPLIFPLHAEKTLERKISIGASLFQDVHLFTISNLPQGISFRIAGVVCARSVKVIVQKSEAQQQELRDEWRNELREEVRSHARALNCNCILGYTETSTLHDEICLLSGYGTAVRLLGTEDRSLNKNKQYIESGSEDYGKVDTRGIEHSYPVDSIEDSPNPALASKRYSISENSLEKMSVKETTDIDELPSRNKSLKEDLNSPGNANKRTPKRKRPKKCSSCHIPYTKDFVPFRMNVLPCNLCGKRYVPEVLLCTIEPPEQLGISCQGKLLQARVFRDKKTIQGENYAALISEMVPFIELELHRQLLQKLRILGYNAAFNIKMEFSVGEEIICATATSTAVYCPALPPPPILKISRNIEVRDAEDEHLVRLQKRLMNLSEDNYNLVQAQVKLWIAKFNLERRARKQKETRRREILNRRISSLGHHEFVDKDVELSAIQDIDSESRKVSLKDLSHSDSSATESSSDSEADMKNDDREFLVMQIDDETDERTLNDLIDPMPPQDCLLINTELPPMKDDRIFSNIQLVSVLKRARLKIPNGNHDENDMNEVISEVFHDIYSSLCFSLRNMYPCCLAGLQTHISIPHDNNVEILVTAMALNLKRKRPMDVLYHSSTPLLLPQLVLRRDTDLKALSNESNLVLEPEQNMISPDRNVFSDVSINPFEVDLEANKNSVFPNGRDDPLWLLKDVEVTSLSYIPGKKVVKYLGRIHLTLIRESFYSRDKDKGEDLMGKARGGGKFGEFSHLFLNEAMSIARAHVASRGGNALLGFQLNRFSFKESKNQQYYGILELCGEAIKVVSSSTLKTKNSQRTALDGERTAFS